MGLSEKPFGEGGIFDSERQVPAETELPSVQPEEPESGREVEDGHGVDPDSPEVGEEQ